MLRSIRWTLQFWHATILILAVVGIGAASVFEIRRARFHEIDSELESAGQLIFAKLRGPGNGMPPPPMDDMDGGPGPDDQPPWRFNHDGHDHLPRNLDLPPGFLQRYGGSPGEDRAFILYRGDNQVLASWGMPLDPSYFPKQQLPANDPRPILLQNGDLHQVLFAAPAHSKLLISASVVPIKNELRRLIWILAATGCGVVLLGLTGGWFFTKGAVRPIAKMTAAAETISATHLSERIDLNSVPGELADLARVLNAAFGRLEIAFAQQARFTADASHELRTPLAVVLSHTQLALSRERSADEYRKTLATCLSASQRMKGLVDSLLLLSHADVGELSVDKQPMDLGTVVSDSVAMLLTLAAERSITIQTKLASVALKGDALRIGQLAMNLITNAIRYNREGGRVSVSTAIAGEMAVFTVTDTGVGISPEDQARVFDRFFRADKARSRDAGGSGLGLAICKSIVEAHGGKIQVKSDVNVGSSFTVHLPMA
jgi:heavy metal sensor kinase